ncbi:glycosyltransferase [Zobellia nedashkovskayae]|uniref:glycosyltransferase n=1 Tax=Zobellia nedashkovskayae TaxID=2779510 RepID=UPI00188D5356|nr:glycosyltransferase [Zobellia nedashkovskayae]
MKENLIIVSILIAARNEEDNLSNCLDRILNLNFPKEQLEVLVGDDNSLDNTLNILKNYEENYPHIKVFHITENLYGLKGKANVLTQIADNAKGKYFFMTDADVLVNKNWINSVLANFSDTVDMIGGITGVVDTGIFSKYQNFDWIYSYASRHIVSKYENRFFAAMGNNMAMKSKVYKNIGGYKKIPFSIAEDYDLFKHAINLGFKAKSMLEEDILAFTYPIDKLSKYIAQQRRWLTSVKKLPLEYLIGHIIQFGLLPIIILLSYFVNLEISVILFSIKYLVDIFILSYAFIKLKQPISFYIFLFPIISIIIQFILLMFQLNKKPIVWKDREYTLK